MTMGIALRPVLSTLPTPRSFLVAVNQLFPPRDRPLCRLFSDLNGVRLDHEMMLTVRVGCVWYQLKSRNLWARIEEMCRMQVLQWKITGGNFMSARTNKRVKRKEHILQPEHAGYPHRGQRHPRQALCLYP